MIPENGGIEWCVAGCGRRPCGHGSYPQMCEECGRQMVASRRRLNAPPAVIPCSPLTMANGANDEGRPMTSERKISDTQNNLDIAREWGVVNNRAELVTFIDWVDDGEEHGDQWPTQIAHVMRLCVEAGKVEAGKDAKAPEFYSPPEPPERWYPDDDPATVLWRIR